MILSGHYQMSLAPLERLDPYGGTYDIVWTLSNVPGTFGRLDPYGGTYDIVRTLSNVPSHLGRLGPNGGTYDIVRTLSNDLWSVNIICPGHYQMSLGNAKCPMVIINCTHF